MLLYIVDFFMTSMIINLFSAMKKIDEIRYIKIQNKMANFVNRKRTKKNQKIN